jgi:hypothetical protein
MREVLKKKILKTIDTEKNYCYSNKGLEKHKPPSSSGLGHLPFTEATGIQIPLGVLKRSKL